jgi:hypothetical protein
MIKKTFTSLALVVASCAPAYAQQCIGQAQAQSFIEMNRMTQVSQGMAGDVPIATFSNAQGQFIIVARPNDEVYCLIASGDRYEQIANGDPA